MSESRATHWATRVKRSARHVKRACSSWSTCRSSLSLSWGSLFAASISPRRGPSIPADPLLCRRLTAHTSCVNALAWSGNGRWLASAGDGKQIKSVIAPIAPATRHGQYTDRRVLLWDFHPLDNLSAPLVCTGPRVHSLFPILVITLWTHSLISVGQCPLLGVYCIKHFCLVVCILCQILLNVSTLIPSSYWPGGALTTKSSNTICPVAPKGPLLGISPAMMYARGIVSGDRH